MAHLKIVFIWLMLGKKVAMTVKKLMLLFGLDDATIFYDLQFALGSLYVFVGATRILFRVFTRINIAFMVEREAKKPRRFG